MDESNTTWAGVSVRPACPLCGKGGLTGEAKDDTDGYLHLKCRNEDCKARIVMDLNWNIIRAERHYWADGSLIG